MTQEEEKELLLAMFRTMCPEFNDVPDEEVVKWFAIVRPLVSRRRYKDKFPMAIVLLAAHRMKLNGLGDNTTGTISNAIGVGSYSEGEVSVSYGYGSRASTDPDSEFTLTTYGLQFLQLRSLTIVPILNAGSR